jgi:hypothetical protein
MSFRRQFTLPDADQDFLDLYALPWEALVEGSQWVLIHTFPTHPGYNHERVSIAIRIETGYPIAALDMVYVFPALTRRDRQPIPKTNSTQQIDGKRWQRWSRHRTAVNPWRPGEDSLEHHVFLIEDWFAREFSS